MQQNPDITPTEGLSEGDLFRYKVRGTDFETGLPITLDGGTLYYQNENDDKEATTPSKGWGDFAVDADSEGAFWYVDVEVGGGFTQFTFIASGSHTGTVYSHVCAEHNPITVVA